MEPVWGPQHHGRYKMSPREERPEVPGELRGRTCVCNRADLVSRGRLHLLGGGGEAAGGGPRAARVRETVTVEGRLAGPGRGWASFAR